MLGALDNTGTITDIGRQMAGTPLDPCLSRMLLESCSRYSKHSVTDRIIMHAVYLSLCLFAIVPVFVRQ